LILYAPGKSKKRMGLSNRKVVFIHQGGKEWV
jgi:hypothetical protein